VSDATRPLDRDARLAAILGAHGAALGRLAASYVREPGERDDLYQDIVIAIWKALPGFRGECSERTFIFRIAHNRGVAHLARRRVAAASAAAADDVDVDVDIASRALDPEQALSKAQQGRRLFEAVRRLPLGYRQVVTLTLEGLGYGEIADVLGISESNVGARLTRARQMLRRML
jgi:RNA polymerase sigma factor (sigma-70 family)